MSQSSGCERSVRSLGPLPVLPACQINPAVINLWLIFAGRRILHYSLRDLEAALFSRNDAVARDANNDLAVTLDITSATTLSGRVVKAAANIALGVLTTSLDWRPSFSLGRVVPGFIQAAGPRFPVGTGWHGHPAACRC